MTQDEIRKKYKEYKQEIQEFKKQISHVEVDIQHLQLDCEHMNMQRRGYAFAGDYWQECLDCGLVK